MIIESISIESFGKLNKLELSFNESLNIIEGDNESGKSTVAAFIKYMLYGFSGRASETSLSDKKRFISWQSSTAEGSMTVRRDDGERYKIMRKTVLTSSGGRELYRESSSIIDLRDGSAVFPKQNAGDVILGLPEEIFENVAFVGQFSDSSTSPDTTEAIQNLLFSGDESVNAQKALDKLELARRALLHKNGKGGKIYELSTRLDELNARFSDAVKKNEEIFECEATLAKTEAEIRSNDEYTEHLCACVETYDNICVAKEFAAIHAVEKSLLAANEKKARLISENTYEGFYPDGDYVTSLAVAHSKTCDAKAVCERTREKSLAYKKQAEPTLEHIELKQKADSLGGTKKILQSATELEHKAEACKKKAKTLLGIGIPLCLVVVGIFLMIASSSARRKARASEKALQDIYTAFGIGDTRALTSLLTDLDNKCRAYESAEALYLASKAELDDAERTVLESDREFARLLAKWGIHADTQSVDVNEIREKILLIHKEEAQIDSEIYKLDGVLSDAKSKLSGKDEEQIALAIEKQGTRILDFLKENDINKINDTLTFCRSKGKALSQKERDLREKYLSLKASTQTPSEIKEKIFATQSTLDTLKKQHTAYLLAHEAIEGAGERLRAQMSPKLSSYAKNAIDFITDGKYNDVGVDSSLSVTCAYENELRTPEAFSAGTRMAIYLSLRMALADMLSKERLPLCLDETLVYQDDTRARKLISFLEKESRDKLQCFLFTCHSREALMVNGESASVIKL